MSRQKNILSPTIAIATYALAYLLSLFGLAQQPGFSPVEPLFVLGVLGIGMPLLALALTRNARNPESTGTIAPRETGASLVYLALFALLVLGFGFSAINEAIASEPARSLAKLATKLATMVALPVALLAFFGHRWRDTLAPGWHWPRHGRALIGIGLALLAFQAVFGRGLQTLDALNPAWTTLAWAVPACFLLASLEAGLCEEVLFRVFLQTRLAALLKSELGAIAIGALLFGLAHAPGLYLRGAALLEGTGGQPTLLWSISYAVAIISPAGILFGVLWSRTRSLLLIVVLHGLTDTLPHLAPFIETWTGG